MLCLFILRVSFGTEHGRRPGRYQKHQWLLFSDRFHFRKGSESTRWRRNINKKQQGKREREECSSISPGTTVCIDWVSDFCCPFWVLYTELFIIFCRCVTAQLYVYFYTRKSLKIFLMIFTQEKVWKTPWFLIFSRGHEPRSRSTFLFWVTVYFWLKQACDTQRMWQ